MRCEMDRELRKKVWERKTIITNILTILFNFKCFVSKVSFELKFDYNCNKNEQNQETNLKRSPKDFGIATAYDPNEM